MNGMKLLLLCMVSLLAVSLPLPMAVYAQPSDAPIGPAAPVGRAHVSPLFDPNGPSGGPGVWLWDPNDENWMWQPARTLSGQFATMALNEGPPPWPKEPSSLWVVPTSSVGFVWVWDIYAFAGADGGGPHFWRPRWRLAYGEITLGGADQPDMASERR